jgi:hypothetical protein
MVQQPYVPPDPSFSSPTPMSRELERLSAIADWMDRRYLDPILGLVLPGAGDTLCSLVGLYGVFTALRLRVHPVVVARMLINLALDSMIGSVPLIGWIGDFFFRAHTKNLRLLQERAPSGKAQGSDWLVVGAAALLFLFALALPIILLVLLAGWIFSLL